MQANSSAGFITIDGDLVSIGRMSLRGLSEAVRTVAIGDLVGLDLRQATAFEPGYIRLIYPGASAGVAGKLRLYDPDTIMFNIEHQEGMLDVHDALMSRISGAPFVTKRRPATPGSSLAAVASLIGAVVGLGLMAWWICS
jgi:hypothetical protein